MNPLLQGHCAPTSSALGAEDLAQARAALPDWDIQPEGFTRQWRLRDFHQVMDAVNALAPMIHEQDHHPDLSLGYNTLRLHWSTHSAGQRASRNDAICAAKADAIMAAFA